MKGTKLSGTPLGSSPISPDSCAPTGLKYLRMIEGFLLMVANSLIIFSQICFVSAYGDSAFLKGEVSVTGKISG